MGRGPRRGWGPERMRLFEVSSLLTNGAYKKIVRTDDVDVREVRRKRWNRKWHIYLTYAEEANGQVKVEKRRAPNFRNQVFN